MRRASLAVAAAVVSVVGSPALAQLYSPIDEGAARRAVAAAKEQAAASNKPGAALQLALVRAIEEGRIEAPLADYVAMECPVRIRVMNPTKVNAWDVLVQVEQSRGETPGHLFKVRLPVLPARMQTVVEFDCYAGIDTIAFDRFPDSMRDLTAKTLAA